MAADKYRAFTCYASAARTATPTPMTARTNSWSRGVLVHINVTAVVSTPSVTFAIQGQDPISGTWYTILTSAAIVAAGLTTLRVFPGAPVTANLSANDVLPSVWRIVPTHGNANSITYSVAALTF